MKSPDPISFSQVLESLKAAVLVVDRDRKICFMNASAEDLLQLSAPRVLGLDVLSQLPLGMTFQAALLAANDGATTTLRECQLRRPGQAESTQVDCTVSPLNAHKGRELSIVELSQVEQLSKISRHNWLEEKQSAFAQIVRSLAHEIKNPLGGLRGAAQLLDRELSDQGLREYTRIITHEADRLSDLVDRLMGGSRGIKSEPFNLHSVIEHVRKLTLVETPHGLNFERDYDPSIPEVIGDQEQMTQAILNIVRNAVEAMRGAGNILLKTRVRRQKTLRNHRHRLVVEASITDDGPGIDDQIIDRIFFPMVTGRADGTGLGLAITQEIIRRHDGVIECTSRPSETRFSVFLPVGHSA